MSTPDQPQGASASPDLKVLLEQGLTLLRGGQTEAAVKVLQEVVQKAPNHVDALLALGSALAQQGDLPSAAQALERAVAVAPQSAAAHFNLGVLRLRQDHRDLARDCFQRALAINPQYSKAQAALAELGEPPPAAPKASPSPTPAAPAAEPEEGGEICQECGEKNPVGYTQCRLCGTPSGRALARRHVKEEARPGQAGPRSAEDRKALRLVQAALVILLLAAFSLKIRDLIRAKQWGVSPVLVLGVELLSLVLEFVIPTVVTLVILRSSVGMQSPEKIPSASWTMGVAMVLAYCLWDLVIIPFFGVVLQFLPFYLGYYLYYALFYLAAMVVLDKTVRMNLDMAYAVAFKILLISAIFLTVLQVAAQAGLVALGVVQKVQEATAGEGTPAKPATEDIPLYPNSLKSDLALDLGPIKAFAYTVPSVTAEQVVTYFKEQMVAKGWTLHRAPPPGDTGYELAFVREGRECDILVKDEAGGVKYMISEMPTQ